jgi:hypothetical protein
MKGDHLEDSGVDGRIILNSGSVMGGIDWIDLAQVAGCCEGGNEPSACIICGEFPD